MSHFAKVLNGTVLQVIVAEPEFFETFIDSSPGEWVQTSYNTYAGQHPDGRPLRKNYATVGGVYDKERDAFYIQKPYPSWVLDEETCIWNAPIPLPQDEKKYQWNEAQQQWDEINPLA